MERLGKYTVRIVNAFFIFCVANIYPLAALKWHIWIWGLFLAAFLFLNIRPALYTGKIRIKRLKTCQNGCELLGLFLATTVLSILFQLLGIFGQLDYVGEAALFAELNGWADWLINILLVIVVEAIVFWNGIIRVYTTSAQLGIKWRVIGIICGWIPIAHLVALHKIMNVASAEVKAEDEKALLDETRREEQICATKYPILMVHGVFFRDFRYFNYWGRIPEALQKNGAIVYYGNHQSASSVADSGQELFDRIKEIVRETGCEKVNIIAHSKGGLDCRYALSKLGAAPFVASLTTINTPHRGCEFADYLLSKIPQGQQEAVAKTYNAALKKMGDHDPDFLSAVYDLTADSCRKLNESTPDVAGVYYQSVGSCMRVARGGRFPLNMTHALVKYFDGENDGLVGKESFPWGANFRYLTIKGNRGISHGDMIDLNRENFPEFDVREFYVQLVKELKERGF